MLVDVTESPIARPKKQRNWYSGKKKKHTIKTQLVVNRKTKKIICTAHAGGKTHDFKLFEMSIGNRIHESIFAQLDSGYQGILKFHANSEAPKKKPKGGELAAEEKSENKRLSRERIFIENVNAKIKVLAMNAQERISRR